MISVIGAEGFSVYPGFLDSTSIKQARTEINRTILSLAQDRTASSLYTYSFGLTNEIADSIRLGERLVDFFTKYDDASWSFMPGRILVKPAGADATPWHQDRAYWQSPMRVRTWINLSKQDANSGCLRLLPNSHSVDLPHYRTKNSTFKLAISDQAKFGNIVDIPVEPGTLVVFDEKMVHGSHINKSNDDLWIINSTMFPCKPTE